MAETSRLALNVLKATGLYSDEALERISSQRAELNFPMVLPFLSCGLPLTFRSNKTIIQITQQASTAQTVSFGILIFNENKA